MDDFFGFIVFTLLAVGGSIFIFVLITDELSAIWASMIYTLISGIGAAIGYASYGLGGALLYALGAIIYVPSGLGLLSLVGILVLAPVAEHWEGIRLVILFSLIVIAVLIAVVYAAVFLWDVRL